MAFSDSRDLTGNVHWGRVLRGIRIPALVLAGLSATVIGAVWVKHYSPFRSATSRARQAFAECLFGDAAACPAVVGYYQQGCDEGDRELCLDAAWSYRYGQWTKRDPARAAAIYSNVCQGGHPSACYSLGRLREDGNGTPLDLEGAFAAYLRACELGASLGCNQGGVVRRDSAHKSLAVSVALFRRACSMSSVEGCYNLGLAYARGAGVEHDGPLAVALLGAACESDFKEGCVRLAELSNAERR